jgi:nucleoid-associated protein YgaU
LFEIAKRYYGNGRYWKSIAQANAEHVTEDGQVRKGVTLVIPDRAGRANRPQQDGQPGNNSGSQPRVSQMQQVVEAAESRTITVQSNDTLSGLARQYLNDRSRWRAFLEHNPGKLEDPNDIRPGMTLKLPPLRSSDGQSTNINNVARRVNNNEGVGGPSTYTVQPNDTLYSIAKQQLGDGSAWRKIYNANQGKLDSPDDLTVGETLQLPQQ